MERRLKVFIIRPIRNISEEFESLLREKIADLRLVYDIYDPSVETNQRDETGLRICLDNKVAIANSDFVFIAWDGKSQGCLFDAGIAFSFYKPIVPLIGLFPEKNSAGKSFSNMIWDWSEITSDILGTLEEENDDEI